MLLSNFIYIITVRAYESMTIQMCLAHDTIMTTIVFIIHRGGRVSNKPQGTIPFPYHVDILWQITQSSSVKSVQYRSQIQFNGKQYLVITRRFSGIFATLFTSVVYTSCFITKEKPHTDISVLFVNLIALVLHFCFILKI